MSGSILLWYRLDLRVSDHPALAAACASGLPVIPVFIWDPSAEGAWAPGKRSRRWLAASLRALDGELRRRGSRLLVRSGDSATALLNLARETKAREIHWSRRYEPNLEVADRGIVKVTQAAGLLSVRHPGNLLREPESVRSGAGTPYQVFTPFWKAFQVLGPFAAPVPTPERIPAPTAWPDSADPGAADFLLGAGQDLAGLPGIPGAVAAESALRGFISDALSDYPEARDVPADPGTSRLAPHLHFGEIGPRRIFLAVEEALREARGRLDAAAQARLRQAAEIFRKELGWREFAHHVLVHQPHTPDRPLREAFADFPWADDAKALAAWQEGRTGYPMVDAGMRELKATGAMHNRVRMITASFLVKDLLIPWRKGARWFWDNLADADLASNTLNWQWVAGCGADAAPYHRIFNPVVQGERFDPHGDYVRKWVPELARAPEAWIHRPWEAGPLESAAAGIALGKDYPRPMVDHGWARERALAALRSRPNRPTGWSAG